MRVIRVSRFGAVVPAILLVCITLVLGACATSVPVVASGQQHVKNGLVVRDLLYVMAQILPPNTTTFQLGKPNSPFGRELENGFREIGYGMQRMEADQGPMFMTYTESIQSSSSATRTLTYSVFIGDVGLERAYVTTDGGGVAPIRPMKIFGTNQAVKTSARLFPGQAMEVTYVKTTEPEYDSSAITVIDKGVMEAITTLSAQPVSLPSYKSLNSQNIEIENIFRRGSSNFTQVNRDYRLVRKDVIVFSDDSLLLQDKGREQIVKLLKLYQSETDVFRLVGCSNGPTAFEGGNVALALGRAERVATELASRNVKKSAILDEGCWAGQALDEFPSRGVVVELQRQDS